MRQPFLIVSDVDIKNDVTWRQFRLEHVEPDDVDDEDPDGALQNVGLHTHEHDSAEALRLQSPSVRVRTPRFPWQIRLELVHVKQLPYTNNRVHYYLYISYTFAIINIRCVTFLYISHTRIITLNVISRLNVIMNVRRQTIWALPFRIEKRSDAREKHWWNCVLQGNTNQFHCKEDSNLKV